jgi:hypothetical protein
MLGQAKGQQSNAESILLLKIEIHLWSNRHRAIKFAAGALFWIRELSAEPELRSKKTDKPKQNSMRNSFDQEQASSAFTPAIRFQLWPPFFTIESPPLEGWIGEKAAGWALNRSLDASTYKRVDNVIIPTGRGAGTSQIDHTIVSRYGIFVVEIKNYKGQIYGQHKAPQWLQVVNGGRRWFPNPIRQNYGHVTALAEFLGYPEPVFQPVVFFIGDSVFKTAMPPNVLSSGLVDYILARRLVRLREEQVHEAVSRLAPYRADLGRSREHVRNVQRHLANAERCPRCHSGRLVVRKAKNDGRQFWGCTNFPACRFTRSFADPFPQKRLLKTATPLTAPSAESTRSSLL